LLPGKYPYANVNGGLIQLLDQLKKSFPGTVDADLLKKLDIAPKNESYIINVVRFLGLIDDDGKKTATGGKAFTLHEDHAFKAEFAKIVRTAYGALFDIYGDDGWSQPDGKLISFFRQTDQSSEIVGGRQASTFKTLAVYAGRVSGTSPNQKPKSGAPKPAKSLGKQSKSAAASTPATSASKGATGDQRVSLTVRIEVNLPAGGDQDTYDRIFKSIRENLMNG
jgi:Family of unknown function (DUF5343)